MGLDYSMVFIVQDNNKAKIYDYIKSHGSFYGKDGEFCSLKFDIDYNVIKYLQGWNKWSIMESWEEDHDLSCFKDDEFNSCWKIPKEYDNCNGQITPEFKAEIGGFDIYEKQFKNYIQIGLTAVTSDMSSFVKESLSVHNWLIECCKYAKADLGYLDLESSGNRILYYNNKLLNLLISGENPIDMQMKDFISMMTIFKESLDCNNKL